MLKMIKKFLDWVAGLFFYIEEQEEQFENENQIGQKDTLAFISQNSTESFVEKKRISELVSVKPSGLDQILQSRKEDLLPKVPSINDSVLVHISQSPTKEVQNVSSANSSKNVKGMTWKEFKEYNMMVNKYFHKVVH